MRLLYIADGRSATARNWITDFLTPENEVHLISTSLLRGDRTGWLPCRCCQWPSPEQEHPTHLPDSSKPGLLGRLRQIAPIPVRTFIRQWLGPLTLPRTARRLSEMITEIQPDLVHAMRYPFEGILAAQADPSRAADRLRVGQRFHPACKIQSADRTRHPQGAYNAQTPCIPTASGISCLAQQSWFLLARNPRSCCPDQAAYGINLLPASRTTPGSTAGDHQPARLPHLHPQRCLLQSNPAGAGKISRRQIHLPGNGPLNFRPTSGCRNINSSTSVELLPLIPQGRLADLFRQSHIVVSPSTHDGTPNTLLEAMACGCFPVAGNIESIREWLVDGENSLLVDPGDPEPWRRPILRCNRGNRIPPESS